MVWDLNLHRDATATRDEKKGQGYASEQKGLPHSDDTIGGSDSVTLCPTLHLREYGRDILPNGDDGQVNLRVNADQSTRCEPVVVNNRRTPCPE